MDLHQPDGSAGETINIYKGLQKSLGGVTVTVRAVKPIIEINITQWSDCIMSLP